MEIHYQVENNAFRTYLFRNIHNVLLKLNVRVKVNNEIKN